MTAAASKTYHKCTVSGDFIKKEAGGKTNGTYEVTVNVPHLGDDKTDIHYMSVIKKELLQKALKAKYPNAITFRTHEMVDRTYVKPNGQSVQTAPSTPAEPVKKVSSMNKTELTEYIQAHEYDIDIETVYTTVDKMRKAIASYEENKEVFLKEQAGILAEIELKNTLADLNPMPQVLNDEVITDGSDNDDGELEE